MLFFFKKGLESSQLFNQRIALYCARECCINLALVIWSSIILYSFFSKCFICTYFNLNYFMSVSMLTYTRNFLFSLQNCWKSTSKNLGHGLMHRPLSRQVCLTLKNINLLAPMRRQYGGNHLRRPKDKPINVITHVERQQILPWRRPNANQHN